MKVHIYIKRDLWSKGWPSPGCEADSACGAFLSPGEQIPRLEKGCPEKSQKRHKGRARMFLLPKSHI